MSARSAESFTSSPLPLGGRIDVGLHAGHFQPRQLETLSAPTERLAQALPVHTIAIEVASIRTSRRVDTGSMLGHSAKFR